MVIHAISPKSTTTKIKRYDVIKTLMNARKPRNYSNEATFITIKPEKEVEYFSPYTSTGKIFDKKA